MYFLSALYTLQYVLIVKMTLVIFIQKKKKKKKRKPTHTLVWVKNTKVMPQGPAIYLSLGKGRESLRLQTLHKKLSKSALSALPPARKSF